MSQAAIEHAIARYGWRRLTRGLLLTAPAPPTRDDWLQVGLALAGRGAAISGWDAVRIAGLGDAAPPSPEVLVLCREGHHRVIGRARIRPTRRPFTSWTLPADHPALPFEPVVHIARAVADTALLYRRPDPVRALVTSAVQRRRCTVEDIVTEWQDGPQNHRALLTRAVDDLLGGARSIAEAEAIEILRRAPLPAFDANVTVQTRSGRVLGVADALWRGLRAVLEIDSRRYHEPEAKWEYTLTRHNTLTPYGLAVTHYAPAEIRRRKAMWARDVEVWLRARARELGVPYVVGNGRPASRGSGPPPPFVVPDLC